MITGSTEYENYKAFIDSLAESYNPPITTVRIPTDEPIYQIDWDTRSVEAPEYFGVEGDHEAEYLYFEMDRYYDQIDLATCLGLVCFKNANDETYYQLIPAYDTLTKPRKIIFAWDIQHVVAKYGGTVSFAFKFIKINRGTKELLYEINTRVASSKVYPGWKSKAGYSHDYKDAPTASQVFLDDSWLANLYEAVQLSNNFAINWIDLNG